MEVSDLEAKEALGLVPATRDKALVGFNKDGRVDEEVVVLALLLLAAVEVVAGAFGFLLGSVPEATLLPLQVAFWEPANADVLTLLSGVVDFSAPSVAVEPALGTTATVVPALGPDVESADLGFKAPSLLAGAVFKVVFAGPASLLAPETLAVGPGLSFPVFSDDSSVFFFSSIALLLSATASAFSLSLTSFSATLFFLSASCCSFNLAALSIFSLPSGAFNSPPAPDFLVALASLAVAALLGTCLAPGLPTAEAGFLVSECG